MSRRKTRTRATGWERADDETLLDLRFDQLGLELDRSPRTPLQRAIRRLLNELARTGLTFRPHLWFSSDFFSPDGVPGIAIPFYLAHGRLIRLERAQSQRAEGVHEAELLKILRHEAGHAVDTAYGLHGRAEWRAHFGLRSQPYRRTYTASPSSRDFVRYLPRWYAQSHSAEDFAETFAVWLDPRSNWRVRYPDRSSGARRKLEYVERSMRELVGARPVVRLRERTESIHRSRSTLGEHYAAERRRRAREPRAPFADALGELFGPREEARGARSASSELARLGPRVRERIRGRYKDDAYSIEQVWQGMLHDCRLRGHAAAGERAEERAIRRLAHLVPASLRAWESGEERLPR